MNILDDLYWKIHCFFIEELNVIPFVAAASSAAIGLLVGIALSQSQVSIAKSPLFVLADVMVFAYCLHNLVHCYREWRRVMGELSSRDKRAFFHAVWPPFVLSCLVGCVSFNYLMGGHDVVRRLSATGVGLGLIFVLGWMGSRIAHGILHRG